MIIKEFYYSTKEDIEMIKIFLKVNPFSIKFLDIKKIK
jgi:hypothetical protein